MSTSTKITKQLLKDGISELQKRGMISSELKYDTDKFIDGISIYNNQDINYNDFRQVSSTNIIFDDNNRVASFIADGSSIGSLVTNQIRLKDIYLKSIKIKAINENVNYLFSYDLQKWFNINSYNIEEKIKNDFYLKITFQNISNEITGLILIYENI